MSSGFAAPLGSIDMLKIDDVSERDRAGARKDSVQMLNVLQLECAMNDVALVGRGRTDVGGSSADVKVYEVACSNHVGYLLLAQASQAPRALTCFAAAARHEADAARGVAASPDCRLAHNQDLQAMAAAVATAAGKECTVSHLRWFGQDAASHVDYTEVACTDGHGYLLKVPEAGPGAAIAAQVARKPRAGTEVPPDGCRPDAGDVADFPRRAETECGQLHAGADALIGRESVARRYVVEVQCPEQPQGLVAFVPVDDPASRFEAIDCAAALERDVHCRYTAQ